MTSIPKVRIFAPKNRHTALSKELLFASGSDDSSISCFPVAQDHTVHKYQLLRPSSLPFPPASGEPIIFLHGIGDEADTWRHVVPLVNAGSHRLVMFDQSGFGRSDKPDQADYSGKLPCSPRSAEIPPSEKTDQRTTFSDPLHASVLMPDKGGRSRARLCTRRFRCI